MCSQTFRVCIAITNRKFTVKSKQTSRTRHRIARDEINELGVYQAYVAC